MASKVYLTEEQIGILISKEVGNWFTLGLRFSGWKVPYEMEIVDKQKWMLAKIKYGI